MTILTDDERPKLPPCEWFDTHQGPEEGFTESQMEAYADAREAAVLAKLREQEPVAQPTAEMLATFKAAFEGGSIWTARVNHGLEEVFRTHKLYAAPMPAVVQVPKGWKLVPVEPTDAMVKMGAEIIEDNGGNARWSDVREAWLHMLCMIESAAPEAPAQGEPHRAAVKTVTDQILTGVSAGFEQHSEAPARPSVPAPWREAVKVARTTLQDWLGDYGDCAEGGEADELVQFTRAALAQLDALEGGE